MYQGKQSRNIRNVFKFEFGNIKMALLAELLKIGTKSEIRDGMFWLGSGPKFAI